MTDKFKIITFFSVEGFELAVNKPTDWRRAGYELHSWSINRDDNIVSLWVKCELPFQRIKLIDLVK